MLFSKYTGASILDGYSIPLRGVNGELSILHLLFNSKLIAKESEFQSLSAELYRVGLHLFARLFELEQMERVGDYNISQRERECLRWVADGKSSNDVASLLGISVNTVNFHVNNLMKKLNVYNRPQAIAKAAIERIIGVDPFTDRTIICRNKLSSGAEFSG